jgi:hypothetical protein
MMKLGDFRGVWNVFASSSFMRRVVDAWGRFLAMSKIDEYRANAAECHRMARTARDEKDRQTWQGMADSWSRMADRTEERVWTYRT